jgi:hypothetical protein
MDVLDAGVYVGKWEAAVPRHAKVTLWGPLAAKEMGLEGWEVQDGGETGFVMHNAGVKLTMGRATSTLIFARRLERAFLTVYLGGYPTDAPAGQRKLDQQKVAAAAEVFLARIAKQPVRLEFQGELALVDNTDAAGTPKRKAAAAEPKQLGGGRLGRGRGDIIDADEEMRIQRMRGLGSGPQGPDDELAQERSALVPPEHRRKAKAGSPESDPVEDLARKAGYVSAKDARKGKAAEPTADAADKPRAKGKGKSEVWEV